jgi:hypothetical protein
MGRENKVLVLVEYAAYDIEPTLPAPQECEIAHMGQYRLVLNRVR